MATDHDLEKKVSITSEATSPVPESERGQPSWLRHWSSKLLSYGVEIHGSVHNPSINSKTISDPFTNRVSPVQPAHQTYTSFINLFFLWLSANAGIITYEFSEIQSHPVCLTCTLVAFQLVVSARSSSGLV